jgi:hypothetical protein
MELLVDTSRLQQIAELSFLAALAVRHARWSFVS